MESGAQVWCRDTEGEDAWLLCEVLNKTATEVQLKHKNGTITKSLDSLKGEEKDVELANTPLSDAEKAEGRDNDLITLPHLHEPAILHSLSDRFFRGKIYTWTGPVLIAVNPFQRLDLYNTTILEAYRREGLLRAQGILQAQELEPHVFSIADRSYRQMMSDARKSQSILISGESGAGKTESTKIVMLYLTTLGAGTNTPDAADDELSIMQKVLQSNPVLEAFGNARTLRNDNSSRFGKFIELGFSRAGHLLGAKVQTYLLEKVRLAFHAAGERNYHVFYQLLRGCPEEDHAKYEFHEGITGGLELPNYFHFTGQGGAPHLREFTDEEGYNYTLTAMRKLGWSQETIDQTFSVIAGLLHLGQVTFESVEKDGVDTAEIADPKYLEYSSRLLGVHQDKMQTALTERIIVARGQEIKTLLTPEKAQDARDALAKTMYGALFLWVVDQVNQSVGWPSDADVKSSCGVLDIFGFECFAINSFEQLCINFTNEALQQQFNQFIFKLEQAEYEAENIEWAFIEFPDNQDCLDTIQAPKTGILSILDDECRLPKGSDRNFAKRLLDHYLPEKNQTVSENTRIHSTNMQKAKSIFSVRHFAGLVHYSAETNFMEKNRDEIPLTAEILFETAPSKLVQDTYAIQKRDNMGRAAAENKTGKQAKPKTVGQQFKEQLSSLIESVQKTDPHYIRCIKPNDAAKPLLLTRKRTTEQLRYGGVLEAVRVARAGYPVRLLHEGFYQRYRMLLPSTPDSVLPWSMEGQEAQKLCVKLVEVVLAEGAKNIEATKSGPLDPKESGISRSEKIRRMQAEPIPMEFPISDVQLGKTKVFMRKHPHDCLEAHRVFHQNASATVIQCWARGLEQQRSFFFTQDALQTIQRCWRGYKGRERWTNLRKGDAGKLLTNVFRMLIHWRSYNRARKGTVAFQAKMRGRNTRRTLAAVKVETYYRRYASRKKFLMLCSAIVSLQCATRFRIARNEYTELLKEHKDVGKLKGMNEKLKEEMASLRAMLAAQAKESSANAKHTRELKEKQDRIDELEKKIASIEKELEEAKSLVSKLETDLAQQQSTSNKDKEEIKTLRNERATANFTDSPKQKHRRRASSSYDQDDVPPPPLGGGGGGKPDNYVSPEIVKKHRARVAMLEDELESERNLRREADGEIIKLRAAINGVELSESEVKSLLPPQKVESVTSESSIADSDTPSKPSELDGSGRSPQVANALGKLGITEEKDGGKSSLMDSFSKASTDFIPMIRRGFGAAEEKEAEEVAVGWKQEIRNRKEREEALKNDVHKFEHKMKKMLHLLEEGVDVVMWQLNKAAPEMAGGETVDEFALKSSNVSVKMHRRGEYLVQAVLTFMLRGGYLSKAIGRNRNVDKTALEPLSLHDILEVNAGCTSYDHADLPSASGKTKKKKESKSNDNKQASLFMTIKATPTPLASARSYIFRFKSRNTRNDVMNGLRSVLADMQIYEGVSISNLHSDKDAFRDDEDISVPLSAVHDVMDRERENYDRILLMLLQGAEDLKVKEDELLKLRNKLEHVSEESKEKDRVQANDSKLIMQLSKKLETLLMDNEDLRDQNDRLNQRLVTVEADVMNSSGRS